MNKKLLICLVATCIVVTMSVPVFAAESSLDSNGSDKNITSQKKILDSLTEENIKKVIPNKEGERTVQEIMKEKEVDDEFIEKLSNAGDVEVEQADDQDIYITVDVDEPTSTIVYDNGIAVEEKEKFGLLVENESELSTEECVDEMQNIVENSTEEAVDTSFFKFNIIEPVYAYSENAKEQKTKGPVSKIKLKKRIVYYFVSNGGGAPAQNWYHPVRSSSYIMSTTYKIKSLQMKTTYRGMAFNKINNFKNYRSYDGTQTGSKINSPQKAKYYKLSSPVSGWFNEFYRFYFNTTTVLKYVKSGSTKTSTFSITL